MASGNYALVVLQAPMTPPNSAVSIEEAATICRRIGTLGSVSRLEGTELIVLDGYFTSDQLEAIALLQRLAPERLTR